MKKTRSADKHNSIDERELSLDILIEVSKGKFLNAAIDECFSLCRPDQRQRNFIRALCEGVIQRQLTLDHLISDRLNTPFNKVKPTVRQILRMGTYQLKFMDKVPDYAAINECVSLVSKRVSPALKGFVNGVLRSILKEEFDIDGIEDQSIRWSCPGWIIEELKAYPGEEAVGEILRKSLEKPELIARAAAGDLSMVMEELSKEGVVCEASHLVEGAFVIKELPGPLTELRAFKKGLFTLQDLSSQLCAAVGVGAVLGCHQAESGEIKAVSVLDLCAAPGGKALHAAQLLGRRGRVLARDLSSAKVEKINENLLRLGFDNVDTGVGDATVYEPAFEGRFDLVIADLPCSGLGVMNRKSELKYRLKKEDIGSLARLQRSVLDNAVRYVKKGGFLLYSTCTLTEKENIGQYRYLRSEKGMEAVDMDPYLGEAFRGRTGEQGYLQLIQGIDETDGFFISLYRR